MIRINYGLLALQGVLALLALYHLGIGVLAVWSPRRAERIGGALYGLGFAGSPQLRYAIRMLGLYALALGAILSLATWQPKEYRGVIVVVIGLQLARAACRVFLRQELTMAFNISPRRNALNTSFLIAEALVLALCLPFASR